MQHGWSRGALAGAAAALLVVAGCSSETSPGADGTSSAAGDVTDTPEDGADRTGDERTGEEEDGDGGSGGLATCDDGLVAELDAAVAGQLDAFAADDYDLALSFASDGFRAEVDADQLREIIEGGFPVAASATGHTSSGCQVQTATPNHAAAAVMEVLVTATDGSTSSLRYLFSLDADGWGIAGAQPVDGSDGGIVTA